MLKKVLLTSIFVLGLGLMTRPALADNITIQNASFETVAGSTTENCGPGCFWNSGPISGWQTSGPGLAGYFHPNATYFNLPLPDGNVVAFTNGGTISQLTGASELANSFYTLSVFVGNRLDNLNTTYSIAVDLGATTLCSASGNNSGITLGGFTDVTCSFATSSVVSPGDLSIVLTGGGTQAVFDNVSLTVPEPGSLALLGFGSLFALLIIAYSKRGLFSAARLT